MNPPSARLGLRVDFDFTHIVWLGGDGTRMLLGRGFLGRLEMTRRDLRRFCGKSVGGVP